MSYLDQAQNSRQRAGALAGTLAVNAAIGVIVVAGLATTGLMPVDPPIRPIIEFTPQPTPDPPPSPTPTVESTAPAPTAPLPPIPLPPIPGPTADPFDPTDPITKVDPRPDPGPSIAPTPRPMPRFTPAAARPSNDSAGWITSNDYPRRSLVDRSEGVARYRLIIGTNGRVSSCEVTASTGDRQLDDATCRHIARRARFDAATDETGAKVLGTYTGSVRWQIPD